MEMGLLWQADNLTERNYDMTKGQKLILIVLSVIAILLGIGLIMLYRLLDSKQPQEITEPTAIPIQYFEIEPSPSASPQPTPHPVVEIRIPASDESPIITALPVNDEPVYTVTPTPEHAYVHMPTAAPVVTSVPTVPSGMAFTLSILGKTINVANNVEEDTLEKTPGWLPTSAKPGKEGVCVVYGHRNRNHLLILKEIEVNDEIDVIMPDGKLYTYVVEKTEILDTDTAMRIPTIEGKHMILMTCYPFYYTGHAPQKYVVTTIIKDH